MAHDRINAARVRIVPVRWSAHPGELVDLTGSEVGPTDGKIGKVDVAETRTALHRVGAAGSDRDDDLAGRVALG